MLRGARQTRPFNHTFLGTSARLPTPERHPWLDAPPNAFIGDQERIGALVGTQGYFDGLARNRHWPIRFPLLSPLVVETCMRVPADRKSVVWGKGVSVSVDRGGGRNSKKKKKKN